MVFIYFFHQSDLLFLQLALLSLGVLFLFGHLNDVLGLFSVNICQFVLPILHILLLGRLGLLGYLPFAGLLPRKKIHVHLFEFAIVLIRHVFDLSRVVELYQVNGFLDIL